MKPRPAEGRELITQEVLKVIDQAGLSPQSSAWIANRTDERRIENFLPCLQYFLLDWTRLDRSRPLPLETADAARTPGVIVTMQDDPITSQTFPGYKLELIPLPNATHKPEQGALVALLARPE